MIFHTLEHELSIGSKLARHTWLMLPAFNATSTELLACHQHSEQTFSLKQVRVTCHRPLEAGGTLFPRVCVLCQ